MISGETRQEENRLSRKDEPSCGLKVLTLVEPDSFADGPCGAFVKRGYDSGDRFAVFPYVSPVKMEAPDDLWTRSFAEAKSSGSIISIVTDAFDVCVKNLAVSLFDPELNRLIGRPSYCGDTFEDYGPNLFSKESCVALASALTTRADTLEAACTCEFVFDGDFRIMRAHDASSCCRAFAALLRELVARSDADVVCFDGP